MRIEFTGTYWDSEGVKCVILAVPINHNDCAYALGYRRGMPAIWDVRDGKEMPMWFMAYTPTAFIERPAPAEQEKP